MGLTSALNTALFGITYNQKQIDVTASNIANADTAGYSTKTISANVFFDGRGSVSGILSSEIQRVVDEEIQSSYFSSLSETNYASQISKFTARLDDLFGTIEDNSGLNSLMTNFSNSLSALVNDPDDYSAQLEVIASAESLARELNSSYQAITDLRQQADTLLGEQADDVNGLLQSIERIDLKIQEARTAGASVADLLDQRDRYIEQLSGYLDVEVDEASGGKLRITTHDGEQLYADNKASSVSLEPTATLRPGVSGNSILVTTAGGYKFDLAQSSDTGSIVALTEMRDEVLVEAQTQLDTIAAELSIAMSNVTVDSTATTVGLEDGYVLDQLTDCFKSEDPDFKQYDDIAEVIDNVDIVMSVRTQLERHNEMYFSSLHEYAKDYCITSETFGDRDILLLHPGPVNRNVYISDEMLVDPRNKILEQVRNGVAVRMAILKKLVRDQ